ncbi:ABC transporter ATP-binding protein [Arthrobacter sulfonylureivorans]|uniref:ATP-binding cassette domain-containing protein n=1 Tax=Arthrobacter sulfonylureivorans TaxID=2486855 RepID=A0ABY3WAI6_9MICC|nr:ATP-binding cassette domain-containing protein [Arthrobacter sulfonylureivorans]UNK47340.1 ATP-binding cassette domain-containing protein [Arthrobacter sulfonylureivorans]
MAVSASGVRWDAEPSVVVDQVDVHYRTKQDSSPGGLSGPGLLGGIRRRMNHSGNAVKHALHQVSFVGYKGDSIGIVGRNGSGKSTLMRVLAGLTLPTGGAVYAQSQPVLLGVNAALISSLSGAQNIRLGCLAMGMREDEVDSKFASIVDMSGLEDEINHPMNTYSSGMGARLRFAIACAVDPEILLIDEALNTGDAQFKQRSKQRMDVIREQAGTVFLVSHSLGTIKDNCNRCIWLDKGDFVMDGTPEDVTKEYHDFVWRMTEGNKDYGMRIRNEIMSSRPHLQVELLESGWRSAKAVSK